LTVPRRRGYGSPPPVLVRRLLLPVSLLAAAACGEEGYTRPPPLEQFTFPTGIGVTRLPSGDRAVLVVSSNADLLYDPSSGGTLISAAWDPVAQVLGQLGVVQIPSFGGPLVVADADTCPGLPTSLALSASRQSSHLVRAEVTADGGLVCGTACLIDPGSGLSDPFGVGLACRGDRRRAYVGYLDTQVVSGVRYGFVSELDLDTGELASLALATAPYDLAYDAERDRLWITELEVGVAIVQALELSSLGDPEEPGSYEQHTFDLWPLLRGAEPRGIALSNAQPGLGRRAYLAVRVYDPDLAQSGGRPGYDIGAALMVLDLEDGPFGIPSLNLLRMVPLGLGASQVRVLAPRPGLRDLVAITSTTEGLLTIYDDEAGAIAKVFALAQTGQGPENPGGAPLGTPLVGRQPFGIAVDAHDGRDWIYVGAFESAVVTAVSLDPADPSGARVEWRRGEVEP